MPGFQSILTSLASGLSDANAGQTAASLADKAKATWNAQSPGTQGAVAGGLLGLLLSGNARRMTGAVVEVGAAALIGRLAMQAYAEWQTEKAAPSDAAKTSPEDLSHSLLKAMVAATKADEVVTEAERVAIDLQLTNLGLGPEAAAMVRAELDAPLDVDAIAALAHTIEEAAGIYTASLLVIDHNGTAEKAYLATLAAKLGLDAALVRHLEAKVAQA